MALPSLQLPGPRFFSVLVAFAITVANAATFPLPIPTRPTTFPLSRPTLAGEAIAWGTNTHGQISVPPNLTNVVAIAAASYVSLALKSDGTVVGWGDNQNGQISVPQGLSDVIAISAGQAHSVALKGNGTVVAWGADSNGQASVPNGLSSVVAIAAGWVHTLALKSDGTVIAWGYNANGQTSVPVGLSNVVAIAASTATSVAIQGDGTLVMWGDSSVLPRNLSGVVACSTGFEGSSQRTIALRSDGTLVSSYPWFDIPLNLKATAIEISSTHSLALRGDGTVFAWTMDNNDLSGVLKVPPRLKNVIAVAVGEGHMLAIALPRPPIPTTAVATAQIVNGFIVNLNLIDGGEGYDEPPAVTITGGGGSGATATAQISKGIVTGFTITNAGIGYTTQPTITIESPDFLPKLSIAPSRVNVIMQVVPGKRYQLESSDDLPNFSPVGPPFTANSNAITNEFTLTETGQFFRIQEVP